MRAIRELKLELICDVESPRDDRQLQRLTLIHSGAQLPKAAANRLSNRVSDQRSPHCIREPLNICGGAVGLSVNPK